MKLIENSDPQPNQQPEVPPFQTAGRLSWGILKTIKGRMQQEELDRDTIQRR